MKELFHIGRPVANGKGHQLLIQIGHMHAAYAVTDSKGEIVSELRYFIFDKAGRDLEAIPDMDNDWEKVLIEYDFSPSLMLPSEVNPTINSNDLLKAAGFNESGFQTFSDPFNSARVVNAYAVPSDIHMYMEKNFPSARYFHQYAVLLNHITGTGYSSVIAADFRSNEFSAVACRNGKLLHAATFPYSNPADVLYYLLKTCQDFSLSQSSTHLILSGLVDRQSVLFTELYQYFLLIEFSNVGFGNITETPPHFFTMFKLLSKCGS